ncbi:hypothetical protein RHGRI_025401 [Rhododendron griersonianum]|uniref:Pentatricopeptide repeat-containing protein n=1 Tax=Rhododendron griersonianum TaxID=479676 RepID=A0AAV6IV45_9ERIC|nr:hypothetical protein RHGRI_025401 [Rhododendron griersonianum]
MGHPIISQKFLVEAPCLHLISAQVGLSSGIGNGLPSKTLAAHFTNTLKCRGHVGCRRTTFSLQCRAHQLGICVDKVNEGDEDALSSDSFLMGLEKKNRVDRRQMFRNKYFITSTLSLDVVFVENDEESNNEILQRFSSNGKVADASYLINVMALLDDMSSSGCPPDVITYNTILRAMSDNGRFDQAIGFWRDQLRKGCPPYVISSTVLLKLVCEHCGVVRAMEVLEDLAVEGFCH